MRALLFGAGVVAIVGAATMPPCFATDITFGSVDTQSPLPYSEQGFTFLNLVTPPFGVQVGAYVGRLFFSGSGGSAPYHVRATSDSPFDLTSFAILQVGRTFRVESSSGGTLIIPNPSTAPYTLDFTGVSGFKNISYFDIIHDYFEDRRSLSIDTITVQMIPEPTTIGSLTGLLLTALLRPRFFRRVGK